MVGQNGVRLFTLDLPNTDILCKKACNKEALEGAAMLKYTAENRIGTPDEPGYAIAIAADERNRYIAGVDMLKEGATDSKIIGMSFNSQD